ncbi:hypothetical protein B0H16DRAFT_1625233 [Mycena metata]|uniref:BTB domain-containing protein n=1 Tax=Mycena metata TaxID=1033252 RepID=A0AAD7H4U1_9AGAR|nr:hypothetical protein B0H16DRAFT_1625233 [Mycena metata]
MSDTTSLQRAEDLWFSPDLVVLRAGPRLFRVFAGFLKAQSSVFADMSTFPEPASAETETMDGFPVVKLEDDPDEVEGFLKAMFYSSVFLASWAQPGFKDVVGTLRLSYKCDAPPLRRRALEHMESIYPTTLAEYDIRRDHDSETIPKLPDTLTALKVATEVGALWLLPSIYYILCKSSVSAIISEPGWNALGEKERAPCLVGHAEQTEYFPTSIAFLSDPSVGPSHWEACSLTRHNIARDNLQRVPMRAPLETSHEVLTEMKFMGVCDACMEAASARCQTDRQGFWDRLPQMFWLPPWAELEELRRAALSTS